MHSSVAANKAPNSTIISTAPPVEAPKMNPSSILRNRTRWASPGRGGLVRSDMDSNAANHNSGPCAL